MDINDDLLLARQWLGRLGSQSEAMGPAEAMLPERWISAAALLVGEALNAGHTIRVVVPDDETLPELSNALDIDLRPLCLILPEAEFATRIALRATLTLLKSRLARRADNQTVWQTQHERIARLHGTWQAALAWGQSESHAPWPDDLGELFPACLLPASHAISMGAGNDMHVLIAPERMPAELRDALAQAKNVLCLSALSRGKEKRQVVVFDEAARQRFELEVLTREIAELELELATAQAEVANFSQRYYAAAGQLMVELDQLLAQIAAEAARRKPDDEGLQKTARQSHEQAERSQQEQRRFDDIPRQTADHAFKPAAELRKLYRQIAQKIHPDRAANEADRGWRTTLMAEATRAYRSENQAGLQEVLRQWQAGDMHTASADSTSSAAPAQNIERQIQSLKARLGSIQAELDRLLASRLYELLIANRLAARQGRDLLQEIVTQLESQITAARQELQNHTREDPSTCKSVIS